MWEKHGLIWASKGDNFWDKSHAQVPVVDTELPDRWRIYYSSRSAENESYITYLDVEPGNPKNILAVAEAPLLGPSSKLGDFDDCGVMPTSIVTVGSKKYLYYIGWTKKTTVPYHNSIGLLVINGKSVFRWNGPVVSTSYVDPGFQGTAYVMKDVWGWKMWYLSSIGWVKDPDTEKLEPKYHIKFAHSDNGVDWVPTNRVCLRLDKGEGGISSASVIQGEHGFHMWYSVRGEFDYRTNKEHSYRIGYAKSNHVSLNWARGDQYVGIERSDLGWDSQMMCYPYVVPYQDKLYMFYNGNGFGQSGFGYATMENKIC